MCLRARFNRISRRAGARPIVNATFLRRTGIPGKLGDGDGADAKRAVILFLLFCLFFLESLTLAVASKAWRGLTSTIGQQAALILLGAALLGATTLLEPPEVPVRGIGEWSD